MSSAIRCPACGNYGEARIDAQGAFEVRGQYRGKALRKCNRCGAGIFLAWFSRPKLVPGDLWQKMQQIWDREFRSEGSLGYRFWQLEPETKRRLITKEFISHCVDKLAADMAAAVLKHVPGAANVFPEPSGPKYLQGELGAMVIDGYWAALLSFGDPPLQHPLLAYPPEQRAALADRTKARCRNLEAVDVPQELQSLLTDLVTTRLSMEGFNRLQENVSMGNYLYLLTLNGAAWARAEREILE